MTRRLVPPLALALVIGGAAGCGSDRVDVADRTIRVTLDEYRISPQELRAPAGTLRIELRNMGRLTHNLAIQTDPARAQVRARTLRRSPTLQPRTSLTARPIRLRPGTYRLVCTVANHEVLGMRGTLVVR